MVNKNEVMGKIATVEDPELGLNVVDLGLIYNVEILDEKSVYIGMTLTFPGCPYGPTLVSDIERAVKEIDGVQKVDVDIVWEPPWNPNEMASDYAKDVLGIW
jgi:metal-sulfur cluster biosynthetic enzyme